MKGPSEGGKHNVPFKESLLKRVGAFDICSLKVCVCVLNIVDDGGLADRYVLENLCVSVCVPCQ